jgi:hypothetical protein
MLKNKRFLGKKIVSARSKYIYMYILALEVVVSTECVFFVVGKIFEFQKIQDGD